MQYLGRTTRESVAEALRLAHRALELDPGFGPAAVQAAGCHLSNLGTGYASDPQHERNEAVRLIRLALSLDDGDPDTLAGAAAISAWVIGDRESEMEMAERAVALNPNSANAWRARGHVYHFAGLPEEAVRSFERGIRHSPVDPMLYLALQGMAGSLVAAGRFDEAIVAAKRCLRQNPTFAPGHRTLASAYAHLGRDAEARAAAARSLEFDPAFTISASIVRGWSHFEKYIEGLRKAGLPE
jgi:adenylate cyclase